MVILVKLKEYLRPVHFLLEIYFLCIFTRKIKNFFEIVFNSTLVGMVQKQNNFPYQNFFDFQFTTQTNFNKP